MKSTINKIIDIEAALVQKSAILLTTINDLSYTEEDPINKKLSDILALFESTQGGESGIVFRVTGFSGSAEGANGDYWQTADTVGKTETYAVYTNGSYYFFYSNPDYQYSYWYVSPTAGDTGNAICFHSNMGVTNPWDATYYDTLDMMNGYSLTFTMGASSESGGSGESSESGGSGESSESGGSGESSESGGSGESSESGGSGAGDIVFTVGGILGNESANGGYWLIDDSKTGIERVFTNGTTYCVGQAVMYDVNTPAAGYQTLRWVICSGSSADSMGTSYAYTPHGMMSDPTIDPWNVNGWIDDASGGGISVTFSDSGDDSSSNNNPSQNQHLDCYMIDADQTFLAGHYVPHSTYTLNGKPVYYNETTAVSGGATAFLIKKNGCWKLASYTVDDAFEADWQGYFQYATGGYPRCSSNNPENPEDCEFENANTNQPFWYDGMYVTITKCSSN